VMPFPVPYRPRTPAKDFEQTRRRYPGWPQVLAEGDSWFAHPTQWNILYQLQNLGGYTIRRLASIGALLTDMVRESDHHTPQYVRQLDRKHLRWQYLLFSAGGNDLLGANLDSLLRDRCSVSRWEDVLNEEVVLGELEKLRGALRQILSRMQELRPGCKLLVHGYDYPFPRDKGANLFWGTLTVTGPWVRPRMIAKHIIDKSEQRAIVAALIDRYNDEVLQPLHAAENDFEHINLRGMLPSIQQWDDEIHPKSTGFRRIAEKFKDRLDALENAN
jgi:lysophospholipase L1-like esterase